GDRYRIERELGRGSVATVHLAMDLRHNRRVAVKRLRPELAGSIEAKRFLREISIAASLYHPHIIQLYDSGISGGAVSTPYYVMPFIEGESLRDRIGREGPLPVEAAVRIAVAIAGALAYAHDRGIVHRDIKPENVLLQGWHAFVADFGIARALESTGGELLSRSGVVLGTPAYMSPEQAVGGAVVDARTDVYGLGCVLYEMLAGDPPFTGRTAQAIMARHALDSVPPLRTVCPGVSETLENAILTALEKSPERRYQSAELFGRALAASPA
ncbi:MAG: serine/threonine-protein kinase, partial [Gemmatimonadales bacterium]